jgi:hypothetical protein
MPWILRCIVAFSIVTMAASCAQESHESSKRQADSLTIPRVVEDHPAGTPTSGDGPFGVAMGAPIRGLTKCAKAKEGWYTCSELPKTHASFERYVIQATDKTGVCFVKGVGKVIAGDAYGSQLRSELGKLKEQLERVYGEHTEVVDTLAPSSIWDEPRDWMMGLAQHQRYFYYHWESSEKRVLPNSVKYFALMAEGLDNDSGRVLVEFGFTNESLCDDAISAAESTAF